MAQVRKPTPKTQKQISIEQQTAYDQQQGNPNLAVPSSKNRALQTSWKEDTTKPLTIGIQDIDEAVFYYFENVIKPTVVHNGQNLPVPVLYGDPEKWKTYQKDGYLRDLKGSLMAPLIIFKRTDITKNRSIANKLDANNPNLYTSWQKSYDKKNFYSNFNLLNNRVQTKQFVANVVPDYVDLSYSVVVQTYYIEQLNKIVESINYASDAYWGDPERFKFRAQIDSFNTVNETTQGEERSVRSTFTINMYGYIIPDIVQKDLNSIKKVNSKSKFIVQVEAVTNSDIFDPNIRKLSDGRTRKDRDTEGRINSVGDVTPGRETQSPDPGSELRS